MRLLHVTKPAVNVSPDEARMAVVAAEQVVRDAYHAVEQMGEPVKVETELVDGAPVAALIAASRSTTLLFIGDTGAAMHPNAWLGSTAEELARSGHCSVAVDPRGTPSSRAVAGTDITHPHSGDSHMKRCTDSYPEVEIDTVHLQASPVDYLAAHAEAIQLVVVGAAQTAAIEQLLGAPGAEARVTATCPYLSSGSGGPVADTPRGSGTVSVSNTEASRHPRRKIAERPQLNRDQAFIIVSGPMAVSAVESASRGSREPRCRSTRTPTARALTNYPSPLGLQPLSGISTGWSNEHHW
nr:universal stress protein [Mycobacterium genavense]